MHGTFHSMKALEEAQRVERAQAHFPMAPGLLAIMLDGRQYRELPPEPWMRLKRKKNKSERGCSDCE